MTGGLGFLGGLEWGLVGRRTDHMVSELAASPSPDHLRKGEGQEVEFSIKTLIYGKSS